MGYTQQHQWIFLMDPVLMLFSPSTNNAVIWQIREAVLVWAIIDGLAPLTMSGLMHLSAVASTRRVQKKPSLTPWSLSARSLC
jgi:hypothetical protein